MKFLIRTTQNPDQAIWTVALTCTDEEVKFDTRELKRAGEKKEGFPIPVILPESCKKMTHESLCAPADDDPSEIKKLYENIIVGDMDPDEIERFGRYLTATLFGDNWPKMVESAGKKQIELELHFGCEDIELNRLPWEMMYGEKRFFGNYEGRDVSVTRIVSCERKSEVQGLSLPLKVLFVIGRQLDDKLRPGAEYLGMLRRMKIPFDRLDGTLEPRSIDLNTRLLIEATGEDLKAAMEEFRPHIVHFICHGVVDDEGGRILLTKPRDQGQGPDSELEADDCNAETLLEYMSNGRAPNNLPSVVVLNACHTADADNAEENSASDIKRGYLSLAAQLVAGGVPVAIGMAGEIADAACRIFTRNFYQALIKREPIALATARGRRAAMYHYEKVYKASVEWVRPTLFAASDVLDLLKVDEKTQEDMLKLTEIPSKYLGDRNMLCDRFSYLKAFQHFRQEVASTRERKMMALRVNEPEEGKLRFGKTRLLEEIAAHSVLENFIPCLIRNQSTVERPTNLLWLAFLLAEVMDETRERFSITKRIKSEALNRALNKFNLPPPVTDKRIDIEASKDEARRRLRDIGKPGQPDDISPQLAKAVILEDMGRLYKDVNKIPDGPTASDNAATGDAAAQPPGGNGKPAEKRRELLLLFDDLHLYEGVAPLLLSEAMTGPHGLGDSTLTIPLIFTYSARLRVSTNALDEIEKFVTRGKYVVKENLERINDESEARLAYSQFLLSRDPPLSFNWRGDKKADVEALLRALHTAISGVPSLFYQEMVEGILLVGKLQQTLLDADDEKIMESLRRHDEQYALQGL